MAVYVDADQVPAGLFILVINRQMLVPLHWPNGIIWSIKTILTKNIGQYPGPMSLIGLSAYNIFSLARGCIVQKLEPIKIRHYLFL